MKGARPEGARSEQEAARWVSGMFARVAHRYDLANHLLSFNIDRYWRGYTVRRLRPVLKRPNARVLDLCCGTGDLLLALARGVGRAGPEGAPPANPGMRQTRLAGESACPASPAALEGSQHADRSLTVAAPGQVPASLPRSRDREGAVLREGAGVFGSDFCHPMLVAASDKIRRRNSQATLFEADALRLPVADASLDLVTVAFGFRNLVNYDSGLDEMRRVLRPGGMAAILEFSQPSNPAFRAVYTFYSRRILPWIGGALSGSPDAYRYLPESVRRFPSADELAAGMRRAGFAEVTFEYLTGGIVALHVGRV